MIPPALPTPLTTRLDALCAAHDGTVSVWLGDLAGTASLVRDADVAHYAASTMKVPLAVALWRRVVRGELSPEMAVPVHNRFASVSDGSPFGLDEADDQDPATWTRLGASRTVRELAESSIIESGNLATNLLLDLVGTAEVAAVLALAGCSGATVVGRGIEDAAAREAGITNAVTAADLGLLLAAIGRREPALGGEPVLGPVEELLARQAHRNQIPAGLPAGTWTANKTGWIPGVSHDMCLVRPDGRDPFVLVVCTTIDLSEDDAATVVASVAHDLWETMGQ